MVFEKRKAGVLLPVFSLPSKYGIGTFGKEAYNFIDKLEAGKQSYWQVLPHGPTGYGDSPYQSFSTNAGNPYFIDLDELKNYGLLLAEEYENIDWESAADDINYGALYNKRYPVLKLAVDRFVKSPASDFESFCEENSFWLEDYALFMALKNAFGGISWHNWEQGI